MASRRRAAVQTPANALEETKCEHMPVLCYRLVSARLYGVLARELPRLYTWHGAVHGDVRRRGVFSAQ